MTHRLLALLLVLLVTSAAQAATVSQGTRVTLMGDSEAFLLAWEFPRLAKQTGAPFKSVVVPGSSVISWSRELSREWARIRGLRPDVLLVSLGANDACTGPGVVGNEDRSIDHRPSFLQTFRAKLDRTKSKCVVWLGPPQVGAAHPRKDQCSLGLARPGLDLFVGMIRATGIPYFDARTIPVQLWDDQLHCSRPMHDRDPAHGCADWAAWVWQRLTTEDVCSAEPVSAGGP